MSDKKFNPQLETISTINGDGVGVELIRCTECQKELTFWGFASGAGMWLCGCEPEEKW